MRFAELALFHLKFSFLIALLYWKTLLLLGSTFGGLTFPEYNDDFLTGVVGKTGSALFISQSLWHGGFPMITNDGDSKTCEIDTGANLADGWRFCPQEDFFASQKWRNHNSLINMSGNFTGKGITNFVVQLSTGEVFQYVDDVDGTVYNALDTLFTTPNSKTGRSIAAEVRQGDYIFIDRPSGDNLQHGFVIIGWATPVNCASAPSVTNFQMSYLPGLVPYVADFSYGLGGWTQYPGPRPFYCSNISAQISGQSGFFVQDYWQFYTFPQNALIAAGRLYAPDYR